jgi:hypothetical protein
MNKLPPEIAAKFDEVHKRVSRDFKIQFPADKPAPDAVTAKDWLWESLGRYFTGMTHEELVAIATGVNVIQIMDAICVEPKVEKIAEDAKCKVFRVTDNDDDDTRKGFLVKQFAEVLAKEIPKFDGAAISHLVSTDEPAVHRIIVNFMPPGWKPNDDLDKPTQ